MKGIKLFIVVLLAVIVFWIGFMYIVSGGLSSWSIADTTQFRWMLGLILIPVARLWWKFADNYSYGVWPLLRNWKYPTLKKWKLVIQKVTIRYKDAFEVAGWLFAGIAIFGLSGSGFMVIMHYIVTLLGALTVFLIVVRSTKKLHRLLYTIGLLIAGTVWVLGFLGIAFTVYLGEFLFIIPVVVWIFSKLDELKEK